jgi:predicted transcriptional regulator
VLVCYLNAIGYPEGAEFDYSLMIFMKFFLFFANPLLVELADVEGKGRNIIHEERCLYLSCIQQYNHRLLGLELQNILLLQLIVQHPGVLFIILSDDFLGRKRRTWYL